MENKSNEPYEMYIATAESGTQGSYGFGSQRERPAKDCYQNIKWNLLYKKLKNYKTIEQMLQGMTVGANDNSYQSYHECSVWFYIRVFIPENIALQINQMEGVDEEGYETAVPCNAKEYDQKRFKFTTFEKAVIQAMQLTGTKVTPPGAPKTKKVKGKFPPSSKEQSREEYWNDIMKQMAASYDEKAKKAEMERLKHQMGYNPNIQNRGG